VLTVRCSHSERSERLERTLRSPRQLASCSIRAVPPKLATRSSVLIEANSGTLSATAHWLARSRNVGVDIVESKSRTRALIAMLLEVWCQKVGWSEARRSVAKTARRNCQLQTQSFLNGTAQIRGYREVEI
jgi:hypothetical protein